MKILYLPNLTLYDATLTEGGGGGDDGSLKGILFLSTLCYFYFYLAKVLENIFVFLFFRPEIFIFSSYSQGGRDESDLGDF